MREVFVIAASLVYVNTNALKFMYETWTSLFRFSELFFTGLVVICFNMPSIKTDREGKTTYAEVSAMKFNLKEERCLKKNLQLLDVEEDYSLTLINLDNRGVKMYQQRLKDKVAKIKSNLTPTEITEFQKLDEAGKLKGIFPSVTPNLQARITAEAKRLNLDLPVRPRTAVHLKRSSSTNTPRQPPRPKSEKQLSRRESIKNGLSDNKTDNSKGAINNAEQTAVPPKVQVNNFTSSNQTENVDRKEKSKKLPPRGDYPSLRGSLKRHSSERKTISATAHVRKRFLDDHRLSIVKEDLNATDLNGLDKKVGESQKEVTDQTTSSVRTDKENKPRAKTRPITRPESRMDVVRDNLIDSTTPSILSLDSGSVLDLEMVEPTKGKMKLMATRTFTAEEVKELNKRRSHTDVSVSSCYGNSFPAGQKPSVPSPSPTPTNQSLDLGQISPRRLVRPLSTASPRDLVVKSNNATPRSQTAKVSRTKSLLINSPKPTVQRSRSSLSGCMAQSKAVFSSHAPKDGTSSRRKDRGRTTLLSNGIGDDLGNNIQAEIRQDLLEKESEVRSVMDKKVSNYLYRLGQFLDKK